MELLGSERETSHCTFFINIAEKQTRFNVFVSNVMHIHKVNRKNKPYKLQLNKFADMTSHDFKKCYGSKSRLIRVFMEITVELIAFMRICIRLLMEEELSIRQLRYKIFNCNIYI